MSLAGLREFRLLAGETERGLPVQTGQPETLAPVRGGRRKIQPHQDRLELTPPRLRLDTSMPVGMQAYAHQLSLLLGVPLDDDRVVEVEPAAERAGYDLLLWAEPVQSPIKTLIFGSPAVHILERVSTSVLVTRRPGWPLRQILLIVRSEAAHGLAVNWTIRLAQAGGARVTALVVVPQVSPRPRQDLATLLAGDGLLERQSRYVAQRLEEAGVEATLRLRQGSPEQQIRAELNAETYDMVIVAAEPQDWWLRRLVGETVEPVLRRAACPVLVARPGRA